MTLRPGPGSPVDESDAPVNQTNHQFWCPYNHIAKANGNDYYHSILTYQYFLQSFLRYIVSQLKLQGDPQPLVLGS